MTYLSIFRSCLRKEHRDQNIKMLRAVEGEYTRTTYRLQWVGEEALALLASEKNPLCVASLVDRNLENALPCRLLAVVEYAVDVSAGMLHLTFEIGPFIDMPSDFDTNTSKWGLSQDVLPPKRFVSAWGEEWPKIMDSPASDTSEAWRRSIDFLTKSWDFTQTVFLRPHLQDTGGKQSGPAFAAKQLVQETILISSYNAHLTEEELAKKSLHVSVGGLMANLGRLPTIDRDGVLDVGIQFLEPGSATPQIEVRPDPQFSTYIPYYVDVSPDALADPAGPRMFGREWKDCLDRIDDEFEKQNDIHASVLNILLEAFPDDPEVLLRRGRLYYKVGSFALARDAFERTLDIREDARAVAWSLLAALRHEDIADASKLLIERLNLSQHELFDEVVEVMGSLDETIAIQFIDIPGIALGEDKAIRLVRAIGQTVESEHNAKIVMRALADLNEHHSMNFAREQLELHPGWRSLRREFVERAAASGLQEGVEEQAEDLLLWDNETPEVIVERVQRLGQFVNPARLTGILMSNAAIFLAQDGANFVDAGIDQALRAADIASRNGDFLIAEQAIRQVLINCDPNNSTHASFAAAATQVAMRMSDVLTNSQHSEQLTLGDLQHLLLELNPHLIGKTLAIYGGSRGRQNLDELTAELGLKEILWFEGSFSEPPDSEEILGLDPKKLVVAIIWEYASLLQEHVRRWLVENRVPHTKTFASRLSILEGIRATIVKEDSVDDMPPDLTGCADAVSRAKLNFKNLIWSDGVDENAATLDQYPLRKAWAKKIWKSCRALDSWAASRSQNSGGEGLLVWVRNANLLPTNWLSMRESESTTNNPNLYATRVFSVPKQISDTGSVFMPSHVKLDHDHPAPRIHFHDASHTSVKKVVIGYVGPHLPTSQS